MYQNITTKRSANYAFKIVGHLGHDNELFDRACMGGCKGLFSSRKHSVCPKCGRELCWILSADKQPMAISEGTIYPAFGSKQDMRNLADITKRKNGMRPIYRFKMFSFMDDYNILSPPAEHGRCVKGTKVEILSMNHQLVPSWFETKPDADGKREIMVEILIMVYTNYGDYVKILTEQEYVNKTTPHPVYADGTSVPLAVEEEARLVAMEEAIAKIRADSRARAVAKPAATPPPPPPAMVAQSSSELPWEGEDELGNDAWEIDPFENAV